MHWNSKVREMKKKVVKKEGTESDIKGLVMVYDGEALDDYVQWHRTSILGKEDITLHLCKW